jgi:hypothetical protein
MISRFRSLSDPTRLGFFYPRHGLQSVVDESFLFGRIMVPGGENEMGTTVPLTGVEIPA